MKREDLRKIFGDTLSKDQENQVIALHGDSVGNLVTENTDLQAEVAGLKADKSSLEADLAAKSSSLEDVEALKSKNSELEQEVEELKANQSKLSKVSTIEKAVYAESKARDPQSLLKFIDLDSIKVDESGQVSGLTEQIQARQESHPWEFDMGTKQAGYKPAKGSSETWTKESIMQVEDKDKRQALIAQNLDLFD